MFKTQIAPTLFFVISFLISFLGFHSQSQAEIKITSTSGESAKINFISGGDNSGLEIFAGFSGNENAGECANKANASTCNNCVANGSTFASCNEHRAYTTLRFQITFSSTSIAATGSNAFRPTIEPEFAGSGTPGTITFTASPSSITAPNQETTISVVWRELCENVENADGAIASGDLSACNFNKTQNFKIGFDSSTDGLDGTDDDSTSISITISNPSDVDFTAPPTATDPSACKTGGQGLCDFTLKPGDEKAFVEHVDVQSTDAVAAGIANLLLYCDATSTFSEVTQSTPTARVPLDASFQPTENKLTGFKNGTTYSCHAALEDKAGNIGYFFQGGTADCPTGTPASTCRQVTPDTVVGLFNKDTNCFIATAAYGSPMEAHVQMLRNFRNQYLGTSALGRSLVRLYYAVSPPLARWIAQDPNRRATARALLTPVVWSVSVFMNWSWILGVAVLFGCCLLAFRRKFF